MYLLDYYRGMHQTKIKVFVDLSPNQAMVLIYVLSGDGPGLNFKRVTISLLYIIRETVVKAKAF
jgi:hypothetical protein